MRLVLFRFEHNSFWLIDQRKLLLEEVWAPATLVSDDMAAYPVPVRRSNAG